MALEGAEPTRSQLCPGCSTQGLHPSTAGTMHPGMAWHSWNPAQLDPDLPRAHGPCSTWAKGFDPNRCPWHSPVPNWPQWPVLATPLAMGGQNLPWGASPVPGDPGAHTARVHCLGRLWQGWIRVLGQDMRSWSLFLTARYQCQGLSPSAWPSDPVGILHFQNLQLFL